MKRLLSLCLFAATLGGCSSSESDRARLSRVDPTPTGHVIARESLSDPAPDESAQNAILALPPEAGAPGPMRERQYANGWRQSVALDGAKPAGDGNDLSIDLMTDDPTERRGANIPMGKPTQDGVRREILARFPGTPMRIVGRPMRNGLGPFGLAIGAGAGGLRCAFAWQWVDDIRAVKGGRSFFRGKETPASIRMRLCRKGVTADRLAGWFEQLDISDPANIERVVEAARQGTGGRVVDYGNEKAAAVEIVDPSTSLESFLGGRAPTGGEAVARPAPRRSAARRRALSRAAPEAALMSASMSASVEAPGSPALVPQGGRRYLAPVGGVPTQSTAHYAAPPPQTRGAGFGPVRLDPGLPPRAYQGPPAARGGATAAAGYGGQRTYLGAPDR